MADMKQFASTMRTYAKNVSANADRLVRRCALAVDGAVVIATPVDTGRARSNWQVRADQPATDTIDPYDEGKDGSTGGANARAALDQGKAVISRYNGNLNRELHITNNLAYIGRLNDGYSAQAPAGFVEKAMLVGVQAVQSVAGDIVTTTIRDTP
jgi:hypothetical protein